MKIAITGTTSGIGKATVKLLKSKGHEVFEINRPEWDHHDLDKLQTIDLQGYDVLICNAGHDKGRHTFLEAPTEAWLNVMKVCQLAPMMLTQEFTKKNSTGTIIYMTTHMDINSTHGGAYHTAKAGLQFLIKLLRQESKQYRFVDFQLGRIKTNMRKNWCVDLTPDEENWTGSKGHALEPEDIALQVDHVINNPHISTIFVKHIER
jgi:NADP-dependent 3-hydroxy acid dehydrogenase YdfG